jgi:hypothetical protein
MEHLVRSGAVDHAIGLDPIMLADRLAQRVRGGIGIAFERLRGGGIGLPRLRRGAERVFIGRQLGGLDAAVGGGAAGHIGCDRGDPGFGSEGRHGRVL